MRWFCIFALAALAFTANVASADTVTLRSRVEANGPMVTLGDVFDGAGAAASRPIAQAPAAGQVGVLPMAVLAAAASGAGLDWTPPAGVDGVSVVHPAGARATVGPPQGAPLAASASQPATQPSVGGGALYSAAVTGAAIHRGDAVTLIYQTSGIMLSMRTQAMQDAAVGQSIRLLNPSSNRVVLGIVTGPGTANASP
jgi:flagella basal body P-ring formation protein FlgA